MKAKTVLLLAILSAMCAYPQARNGDAKAAPNAASAEVADDPALPRVLLIGDSISMGYTLPVREMLAGKFNVHRIPATTTRGISDLAKRLGDGKWDVIHFNFGLHDLRSRDDGARQVPIGDYEKNLRQFVRQLKGTGATLVWANTTPVPSAKLNPPRNNDDVIAYNAVAKKIMDENQIAIDDLYSLVLPQEEKIQLPANVHFTQQGYGVLANQVAKAIEEAARK